MTTALTRAIYDAAWDRLAREHLAIGQDSETAVVRLIDAGLVATPTHPSGVVPLWSSLRPCSLAYLVIAPDFSGAKQLEQKLRTVIEPAHQPLTATT